MHVSLKNYLCMFQFESFKVDPKPYVSYFSVFTPYVSTHGSYRSTHRINFQKFSNSFQYVLTHLSNVSTHDLFRLAHASNRSAHNAFWVILLHFSLSSHTSIHLHTSSFPIVSCNTLIIINLSLIYSPYLIHSPFTSIPLSLPIQSS